MDEIKSVEDLYARLERYIRWLASVKATDHVLLRQDELAGYLYEELVHGWLYYSKNGLSAGELLAVIRKMLDNRVSELMYRFYKTHRCAESSIADLDDVDNVSTGCSLEGLMDSKDRCSRFYESLTEAERHIVDALLNFDDRVRQQIILKAYRRSFVFQSCTVKVDYRVMADALHMEKGYARHLWKSICEKWRDSLDDK